MAVVGTRLRSVIKGKPRALDLALSNTRDTSIPALDGLRGIAGLIVVVCHYSLFSPTLSPLVAGVAKHGVWLFFILSSFLLAFLFQTRLRTKNVGRETISYAARRFFRIYPMYTVSIILLILVPRFAHEMFGGEDFSVTDHIFLIYPQGIYWSISAEFEFYFLLPVIVLINNLLKSSGLRSFYQISLILAAIYLASYMHNNISFPPNFPHVIPYIPMFFLGSAIGLYYAEFQQKETNRGLSLFGVSIATLGISGLVFTIPGIGLWATKYIGNESWYHFAARPFHISFMWSLILVGVLYSRDLLRRPLSWSWLRFAGVVSYSAYLNHILVIAVVSRWLYPLAGFYLTGVATVFLTYLLSFLTFALIERPCLRWRLGAK